MSKAEKLYQKVKDDYNLIADHFSQTRQWQWSEFSDFKPYLHSGQSVLDLGCGNGRLYFSFLKDLNLEYHGIDINERLIGIAREAAKADTCHSRAGGNLKGAINNNNVDSCFRRNDKKGSASLCYFKVGNIATLTYPDNYFDVIFCIATFHHLPSKELRLKALNEIKRVLKPDGYLLMTNWYWWQSFPWKYFFNKFFWKNSWNDLFIPWKNQKGEVITDLYYHAFTINELKKIINDSGLNIEKIYLFDKEKKTRKKSRINLISIVKK